MGRGAAKAVTNPATAAVSQTAPAAADAAPTKLAPAEPVFAKAVTNPATAVVSQTAPAAADAAPTKLVPMEPVFAKAATKPATAAALQTAPVAADATPATARLVLTVLVSQNAQAPRPAPAERVKINPARSKPVVIPANPPAQIGHAAPVRDSGQTVQPIPDGTVTSPAPLTWDAKNMNIAVTCLHPQVLAIRIIVIPVQILMVTALKTNTTSAVQEQFN